MQADWTIAITFIVYFLAMMGIGVVAYLRTRNLSDYILGGRSLGPLVTALSAEASDMSGWLLLGLPGYAYASGMEAIWIAGGLLIGTYLNWLIIARRLRSHSTAFGDALTISDFFEQRFRDPSQVLRIITAFFILFFFLIYTSAGLVAGGKLFNSVFGWPYHWAVSVGALTIVAYTFLGGFLAVCWTDCIQGLLMFAALVAVPFIALAQLGGWTPAISEVRSINPELINAFTSSDGKALSFISIVSLLGWGIGYFGQPHILARFMAVRSPRDIPAARRIAMVWVTISMAGAVLVGIAGRGILNDSLQGADTEKIFITLVGSLLHPVPAGICLAAVLAAIMSTVDSQLLVSTSVLVEDFYKAIFRKQAPQAELVWVGRAAVVLIALIAFALASNENSKVLEIVAYAWAGFGAAFGPALIMSLYWKRMTRNGALAGIITGGIAVILWDMLDKHTEMVIFDLYEIVPGFLLSLAAIVLTSLLGPPPASETIAHFSAPEEAP